MESEEGARQAAAGEEVLALTGADRSIWSSPPFSSD